MKLSQFYIGREFLTVAGRWRCTDVGTRTIAAIRLNHDDDPAQYNGLPYPVAEHVFDEDGMLGCSPARGKRHKPDMSGQDEIVVVKRRRSL